MMPPSVPATLDALTGGYAVCLPEKVPTLNTLRDVLLVDRSKYLIGERTREVAYSPHERMAAG